MISKCVVVKISKNIHHCGLIDLFFHITSLKLTFNYKIICCFRMVLLFQCLYFTKKESV